MTYSGMTEYATIPVDSTTRVVVYYDDDYQIDVDESIREEVQALVDNDEVYVVTVEKLLTWALLASDGSHTGATREEWEQMDAIHGCFLADNDDAAAEARAYFPEHFTN